MRLTVTDGVAWSVVGRSVTIMSPAEMAEQIDRCHLGMDLGGPRNHVLDGGSLVDPHTKGQF